MVDISFISYSNEYIFLGERPYPCEEADCSKTFKTSYSRDSHKKTHNKIIKSDKDSDSSTNQITSETVNKSSVSIKIT